MQYEAENERLADNSPCAGVRADLKICLLQSDCCKIHKKTPRECLKANDGSLPTECQVLRNTFFECKRSILDTRQRFRGRKGSMVTNDLSKNLSQSSQNQSNSDTEVQQQKDYFKYVKTKCNEEKQLQNLIIIYLTQLREQYESYARLTIDNNQVKFKPILIRLFLWQLYSDLGIKEKDITLIDIDNILAENEGSAVESKHDPFETIRFWQYIQSLVGTCWLLCCKSQDDVKSVSHKGSLLSYFVKKFFDEVVFVNKSHNKGLSLSRYLHLLPIKSVYQLYLEVGNPPTARDFLFHTCVQNKHEPRCTLEALQSEYKKPVVGFNAVPVGHEIMYMPEPVEVGERPKDSDMPPRKDRFYKSLKTFRVLGPRRILNQITKICPQVKSDGLIVNVNYPLTFFEFYEALILCAIELVKKEEREEIRREKELKKELEISHTEINVPVDEPKPHKPNSKEKKGKKKRSA